MVHRNDWSRAVSVFAGLVLVACGAESKSGVGGADGGETSSTTEDSAYSGSGGGSGGDGATGDPEDTAIVATGLTCVADRTRIDSTWDMPETARFSAEGTTSDGNVQDVTTLAVWSVDPASEGTIAPGGLYTAPERNAGPMDIVVEWEGLTATCSVDTYLDAVVDLVGDPAIEAAALAAVPSLSVDCAPYVLYPYDQSRIPSDFFSPEVQWIPDSGQDVFVITFETTYITLRAISRGAAWTPTGDEWWAVADPNAGRDIDMTVLGGRWDGALGDFADGLCGSPWPTALSTEEWGAPGAVFYWTPATQGLWTIDIGAETASQWLDVTNSGQCVGCHSSNAANPAVFATSRGSGGYGGSAVAAVSDPLTVTGGGGRNVSFSALNPSGTRLVRASYGVLYLDDLTTNTQLHAIPTVGWATHPNWSPDGRYLAYSSCASARGSEDWQALDCDLHLLEVLPGDTWGPDAALAIAPPSHSYYYPEFSPDSKWVAFTRNTANADAYDEPTAELMMVSLTGSPPVLLAAANSLPNVTNSWPRWGPIVGDIGWLAFSSRRNYALKTSGVHQVWVTGVNLADVAAGRDGSAPPVWLPGQSLTTGNHTPSFVRTQFE